MKVKDIIAPIEELAPLAYQESYDNSGLIVGKLNQEVEGALICLDITDEVIQEAIDLNYNLIISHHPIVFSGLKRFNGNGLVERCVMKAIKHDIAIYCAHTNLDMVPSGVNWKMAQKIGLKNCRVLDVSSADLIKLVTYVPSAHVDKVSEALFAAGAGSIGNYDQCSFRSTGEGTFRANEQATPFVGDQNVIHHEKETKLEVILPSFIQGKVVAALMTAHPYEEVAYDLVPILNKDKRIGLGIVGELETPVEESDFLSHLKQTFTCGAIRHTPLLSKKVRKVAICGGSGSSLLRKAISTSADFFVTGDFKYHDFFNAEGKIVIADIGHYESEQFTKELFYELITEKIPTFAVRLSEVNTNPVSYFV